MDPITVNLTDNKFVCDECKNENTIEKICTVGDVVECSFCGIEYRTTEIKENGDCTLELLEEEK